MAEIIEFGAMHYNPQKISDISTVIAPPYDKIDDDLKTKLKEKSGYNYVNLTLPDGEGDEKYISAKNKIFSWLLRDVLIIDEKPSYYLYEQSFEFDKQKWTRVGLVGLLKVEDYGTNVLRHERTFPKYVEDRRKLLKESQTHLEGIFLLYNDPKKDIESKMEEYVQANAPIIETRDEDGNAHRIYKVDNDELSKQIGAFMNESKVYIADGHHRYETTLQYMKEKKAELGDKYKGTEPFNFLLGVYFNAHDDAIKIYPTHRVVKSATTSAKELLKNAESHFKFGAMKFTDARMEKAARLKLRQILNQYADKGLFAMGMSAKSAPGQYFILTLKPEAKSLLNIEGSEELKKIDYLVLEKAVLTPILNIDMHSKEKQVEYIRSDDDALDMVKSGNYDIAFIMNAVNPIQVVKIADNSEEMPHKSTDFYPKLLSGLFAYSLRFSKIKP